MIALLLACTPTLVVSDDTAETQDTQEQEAEPVPDYRSYTGDLHWKWDSSWGGDGCEGDTVETAVPIEDEEILAALRDSCGLCDAFYVATQDKEEMCDSGWYALPDEDYRGIVLDEDKGIAVIYRFEYSSWRDEWSESLVDGSASFDGWSVTFESDPIGSWGSSLVVTGTLNFPELETD